MHSPYAVRCLASVAGNFSCSDVEMRNTGLQTILYADFTVA
jgi:hypothetical protein